MAEDLLQRIKGMVNQIEGNAAAQKAVKKTIGKVKAAEMINDSKGRIFTATFIKKDGTERTMNCRRGVTKGVKGSKKAINTAALGLVTVYDMQEKGFKHLNLQTMTALKMNGTTYKVK